MKIYIKNMVCQRCKELVKDALQLLKIPFKHIGLGEIELEDANVTLKQLTSLTQALSVFGLEVVIDKQKLLIEKIKGHLFVLLHERDEPLPLNISTYLSRELNYDYKYLSSLFSKVHGCTIEHFIIVHKIERAKELLVYERLSLKEVAFKLHYSSTAHMSSQFKKITGLTPTHYKKLVEERTAKMQGPK